jgi:hypothetical protein
MGPIFVRLSLIHLSRTNHIIIDCIFCKDIYYIKSFHLVTLCNVVTVFAETKSRLQCIIFVECPLVGVQWRHCVMLLRSCELFSLLGKIKVSKFQNEFMKSSFLPKYERNIIRTSAFYSATLQGRNLYNFWFLF